MIKIFLLLSLLSVPTHARDFRFEVKGTFDVQNIDVAVLCREIEKELGYRLMAETPTDTVHGFIVVAITPKSIKVKVHLYDAPGTPIPGGRRTTLAVHPKKNRWRLGSLLKREIKKHLESKGYVVTKITNIK